MFLSAHFYLWFWLLIFLIVDYVVYYDFISLTVFDWMPGVSFTLLVLNVFVILEILLSFFSGTVKLLETV